MDIKIHKKGYTIIPEGYKFCHACDALTPHNKKNDPFDSIRCCVCDNAQYGGCPNCGADNDEELVESGIVIKHHSGCHCIERSGEEVEETNTCLDVIKYSWMSWAERIIFEFKKDYLKPAPDRGSYVLSKDNEWYYKNRKLNLQLSNHNDKFKCGCPRFTIYRNINAILLESHSYPSQNCSYAEWYKYKTRCMECGFIYISEDDSC